MKLKKLNLNQFKGLTFTIEPQGGNLIVRGPNMAGKTRLFDAWCWLWTGKDSQGRTNFPAVPFGGSEAAVEAVIERDGEETTLCKVIKQKWTKRRGSVEPVMTGHVTEYYINGDSVKMKDFTSAINEICPIQLFTPLTDPRHFPSLPWQEQRKILFDLFVSPQDAKEVETISKQVEKLKRSLTDINKRADETGPRIDEIQLQIEGIIEENPTLFSDSENPRERIEKKAQKLQAEADKLQKQIEALERGEGVLELDTRAQRLQIKLGELEIGQRKLYAKKLAEWEKERSKLQKKLERLDKELDANRQLIYLYQKELDKLRQQFEETKAQSLCQLCGQPLPKEKKTAALQKINERGKALKQKITVLQEKQERLEQERGNLLAEIESLQDQKPQMPTIDENNPIMQEVRELERERDQLLKNIQPKRDVLTKQKEELQDEISATYKQLALVEQFENLHERKEEIQKQARELGQQYQEKLKEVEALEGELVRHVERLETLVSGKFATITFKLFHKQLNGGIIQVCEMHTKDGTPYRAMSNAEKIKAGLDMINALQEHYGIYMPVWVDNAESVIRLTPPKSQLISLVVADVERLEVEDGFF